MHVRSYKNFTVVSKVTFYVRLTFCVLPTPQLLNLQHAFHISHNNLYGNAKLHDNLMFGIS